MPGVLMIEALTQVATVLLLEREGRGLQVFLRGVDNAKFRRQVVPGDQLQLEVRVGRRHAPLVRVHCIARTAGVLVAETDLLLEVRRTVDIDPRAIVHPSAQIGAGTVIGPNAVIGANVRIGQNCRIGASAVVDGWTDIGDETQIFPFASIGLSPQDLKYRGEKTRLAIGRGNIFREFVTIHRGTEVGGGLTSIGDRNLFMAYAHVAHDCRIGNDTIFGNGATLGGHVWVEDFATISAFSGVHQFCRVGEHAFIGGYSVVTKDALPYAKYGRQPGPDLRPQHHRPDPPRASRKRRSASSSAPTAICWSAASTPAAPCARSSRTTPWCARKWRIWCSSSATRSAASSSAGPRAGPRRWWPDE